MKFYIKDSTLKGSPVKLFSSQSELISYVKNLLPRKFNMTYEQYLTHLADLGHFGYDDREIYESLRDEIDMGIFRGETPLRCNIYEISNNKEGSD